MGVSAVAWSRDPSLAMFFSWPPTMAAYVRAGIIAAVHEVTTLLSDILEFVCTTIEGELGPDGAGNAALRHPQ